jgi:outer membrane protein TolC
MKKIMLYLIILLLPMAYAWAQQFAPVIESIEKNNTTLEALRQKTEAKQLESHTGIFLENPELGFNYLWGKPGEIGNRTDVSIMQSIDFPSAYKYRSTIADLNHDQAGYEYDVERVRILHEARQICIDLVYNYVLIEENEQRLDFAKSIFLAVEKMYEEGRVNVIEYNKARLNLSNLSNDQDRLKAELRRLQAELRRLNGGKDVQLEANEFAIPDLPKDFDEWFATMAESNPLLQYLSKEIDIHANEEKLYRALSLPKLSAGYMSEKVVGIQYQGISVGLSIPLWENKNTVKAAKARKEAGTAIAADSRIQMYTILKNHYHIAQDLKRSSEAYAASLISVNNADLLKKAYDMGEISLIEYLLEVQFYYETVIKALETKRDMLRAVAEMEKWSY